jgi:hypothetical protein
LVVLFSPFTPTTYMLLLFLVGPPKTTITYTWCQ